MAKPQVPTILPYTDISRQISGLSGSDIFGARNIHDISPSLLMNLKDRIRAGGDCSYDVGNHLSWKRLREQRREASKHPHHHPHQAYALASSDPELRHPPRDKSHHHLLYQHHNHQRRHQSKTESPPLSANMASFHGPGISSSGEWSRQQDEVFSNDEIRQACFELRKQARQISVSEEHLTQSVEALKANSEFDWRLVEAIYLLKNAHKRGFFSRKPYFQSPALDNGLHDTDASSTVSSDCRASPTDSDGESVTSVSSHDVANFLSEAFYLGRRPSPRDSVGSTILPPSTDRSSSNTPLSKTPSTSSDVSLGSVKRRPKRPDIHISDQRAYKDYIEILREQEQRRRESFASTLSGTSPGDSTSSRPQSFASDASYLNVTDDLNVTPVKLRRSSQNQSPAVDEHVRDAMRSNEIEETLTAVQCSSQLSAPDSFGVKAVEQLCSRRPHSPTSELLTDVASCLSANHKLDFWAALHKVLSPLLHRMRSLEEQAKHLSSIQVKLAVLQEEKRQLCQMLKNKRGGFDSVSGYSTPTQLSDWEGSGYLPRGRSFEDERIESRMRSLEDDRVLAIAEQPVFASPSCAGSVSQAKMAPAEDVTVCGTLRVDACTQHEVTCENACVDCDLKVVVPVSHKASSTDVVRTSSVGVGNGIANIRTASIALGDGLAERTAKCMGTQCALPTRSIGVSTDHSRNERLNASTQHQVSTLDQGVQNSQLTKEQATSTVEKMYVDACTDGQVSVHSIGFQVRPDYGEFSSQYRHVVLSEEKSLLAGAPTSSLTSSLTNTDQVFFVSMGVGDDVAEKRYCEQASQACVRAVDREAQCAAMEKRDVGLLARPLSSYQRTVATWAHSECSDFACGEEDAERRVCDAQVQHVLQQCSRAAATDEVSCVDVAVTCNMVAEKQTRSLGCGDCSVLDLLCDKCTSRKLKSVAVGSYDGQKRVGQCKVDDKLCDCVKPVCVSTGTGDDSVHTNPCERCSSTNVRSVAVSNDRVDDLLCDRCLNVQMRTVACGDDKYQPLSCDTCLYRGGLVSLGVGPDSVEGLLCDRCSTVSRNDIGVGDCSVNDPCCNTCTSSYSSKLDVCSRSEANDVFDFNLSAVTRSLTPQLQQALLCHYCGNKVDLQDAALDDSLHELKERMHGASRGLTRSSGSRNLSLDFARDDAVLRHSPSAVRDSSVPCREEANGATVTKQELLDADEGVEEITENDLDGSSSRDRSGDVIEACKMLHAHFAGDRPLEQKNMVKYMGIIHTLWFKTVKRRRANASVVKSYIDLFQQRIPELLETIINLTDDEGNTALHYALTYKSYGVVSILLDSGECCVDLINQAGYSPIMLSALVGFENKNDRYIIQRLLRMGDINKVATETGQTPLMLAVSRGNQGMVELLLDAGCDVNATDDEGSTALMGACEHGNINVVKALLATPECDATVEDNEGSTALSIAMDSRRKDLALLIYGSLNFDSRGKIKLSPSKQSLLGLGRRSPSPVVGRK